MVAFHFYLYIIFRLYVSLIYIIAWYIYIGVLYLLKWFFSFFSDDEWRRTSPGTQIRFPPDDLPFEPSLDRIVPGYLNPSIV
jgi:hypothetical protein